MASEVKYEEQKHCCTSCAMKRRCHVCDQPTTLACSDCAIDLRAVIYVCNKTQCRDEHEKKCAHSLQSQLDALTEKMNYHEDNQLEFDDLCASERIEPSPCCAPKYCALAPFHQVRLLRAELDAKWISVDVSMPSEIDAEFWVWVRPNAGIRHDGALIKADFSPYMTLCKTYQNRDGEVRFNCGALQEVTHYQRTPSPPPSGAKGETKP